MKTSIPLIPIAALFISSISALGQNFLSNPSFETPVAPAGGYLLFHAGDTIGQGWTVQSSSIDTAVVDKGYTGGGVTWAPPTDGNQFLYLADQESNTEIYQNVLLSAGTSYKLTFDLGSFLSGYYNGASVTLDIIKSGTSISAIGGPHSFSRPASSGFASQVLDFKTTAAGSYKLVIDNVNSYGSELDNFSLTPAVPEPAEYGVLAGIALAAWAYFRRFRQS